MAQIAIQNTDGPYNAMAGGNEYVLATGKKITSIAGATALNGGGDATGRSFYVFGQVTADESSGMVVGDYSSHLGKADSLVIGATGKVSGSTGLTAYADGQWLTNLGTLEGTASSGLYVSADDIRFTNTGNVSGAFNGIDARGDSNDIINQGIVTGQKAVYLEGATAMISNDGTLEGSKLAVDGTHVTEGVVVSNRGTINGNVTFGAGNDVFQNDGGTVNGVIRGGKSADVYYVDQAGLDIRERAGQGGDYVYASVDWTLGRNFEKLVLVGTGDVNGTGNELRNMIRGNDFANRISGLAGNDSLFGAGGDDILKGGSGADTFFFQSGEGSDRILDFGNGADKIHVYEVEGINNYRQLMQHASEHGGNVLISAGDDVLTLVHTSLSDLDKADFIF